MKSISKEVRWALSGFIGGFVLCYLLIGAVRQPIQPIRSAQLTQMVVPPSKMIINLDNLQEKQQLTPTAPIYESPLRTSSALRNVPAGTLPKSYSTELLDGLNQSSK